jgi:hypothetical protein
MTIDNGLPTMTITAIITAYRRPHTLLPLIEAVRGQSVPPRSLWAWANDPWEEQVARLRSAGLDRVVTCSPNAYFHGRFALALLAPTEFVALFDDDSIPGRDWFANCLDTMSRTPGILGTIGVLLRGPSYIERTMHGWYRPSDRPVEVDLVGQACFLRTEWVKYLFAERPVTLSNSEDIELAARAWRLAGIRSYCPPHPPGDHLSWGFTPGLESGVDNLDASVLRPNHFAERERAIQAEIAAGWRPLYARGAGALDGAPFLVGRDAQARYRGMNPRTIWYGPPDNGLPLSTELVGSRSTTTRRHREKTQNAAVPSAWDADRGAGLHVVNGTVAAARTGFSKKLDKSSGWMQLY